MDISKSLGSCRLSNSFGPPGFGHCSSVNSACMGRAVGSVVSVCSQDSGFLNADLPVQHE